MRQLLLVWMLLAGSPAFAQGRTEPALDEVAAAFAAAFNARDAVRIAAFYTEDAVLMPPDQPMVKGRRDIESYYTRGFAQSGGTMRLRPFDSAFAGGVAFEVGASSLSGTVGGVARTDAGKYIVIYRRVGADWKIAYDIFNNDAPRGSR